MFLLSGLFGLGQLIVLNITEWPLGLLLSISTLCKPFISHSVPVDLQRLQLAPLTEDMPQSSTR